MKAERCEIRMAGSGGQGLITGMGVLLRAFALEGRRAAQSQSYEPTSRGGFCYSDLVVSEDGGDYPLATGLDALAALSPTGLERSLAMMKPGALVLVDARMAASEGTRALPFAERAAALGNPRVANVVALGALCALGRLCEAAALEEAVRLECPPKFAGLNLDAVREGFRLGESRQQPSS